MKKLLALSLILSPAVFAASKRKVKEPEAPKSKAVTLPDLPQIEDSTSSKNSSMGYGLSALFSNKARTRRFEESSFIQKDFAQASGYQEIHAQLFSPLNYAWLENYSGGAKTHAEYSVGFSKYERVDAPQTLYLVPAKLGFETLWRMPHWLEFGVAAHLTLRPYFMSKATDFDSQAGLDVTGDVGPRLGFRYKNFSLMGLTQYDDGRWAYGISLRFWEGP